MLVLCGSIGDVTRALPLANLIHRGFPRATLSWAIEPPSLPLIEHHPAVDEIIVFERAHGWKQFGPFLKKIRAGRFDWTLDLQRHLKSGIISRWSGAPNRLGFHRTDCKECNWVFNNRHIPPLGNRVSKLDHYLKFAEYLGLVPDRVEWHLSLTRGECLAVARHLAGTADEYAALFVGSRWESKGWFPAQISSCARLIQERHGLDVVLLGGETDTAVAREVEHACARGVANLVGCTSLKEAIGIIAKAKVAVGPDTGLMHLAAAVGTPVISLWGATSPSRTGPYGFEELVIQGRADCSPCYLKRCPIGRLCMQSIDVEAIMAKIAIGLSRKRHGTLAYETRS
ncbi:MAG TPA: glycosyltransferase family 9 protein [Candidatus Binatia bacterium]